MSQIIDNYLKCTLCLLVSINNYAEQQRSNDRELRKAGRDIERERRKLEVEEKKLVKVSYQQ